MALSYNKFNAFVESLAEKAYNEQTDSLVAALCSVAPVATNVAIGDITQISYTNFSSRALTVGSSSQSGGLYKLIINNLTITYSGVSASPSFRYIVIYDSTATGQELICWFDYGSAITLNQGDAIQLQFDQTNGLFTIQ